MEIKPLYDNTETIKFINPVVNMQKIESKVKKDPSKEIPNGIYKVISWEKIRQIISLVVSGIGLLTSVILIAVFATIDSPWGKYIIPGTIMLFSFYKVFITYIEFSAFKKSINRYREDLKIGLTSVPPFIPKLYLSLHKKQVRQNWLTFFVLFYGGLFTVTLWWLKDFSWWIFKFDQWIHNLFVNPNLMVLLFTLALIFTVFTYITMTIQRKKRIIEVESFFGTTIIEHGQLTIIKKDMNKFYRRIFILSIMILFIIPMVIKIILKILKK